MEGWFQWMLVILGLLVVAAVFVVVVRLRTLDRRVGSFACALVSTPTDTTYGSPNGGVRGGIAHYGVGRLDWYRRWALTLRADRTWARSDLVVDSRDLVPGSSDRYRVQCTYRGKPLVLEMSVPAYAGLTSWLESAPPSDGGIVG